jgi:hypothetical protein
MSLRHMINAVHERRHAHRGSPAGGKFNRSLKRSGDDLV